MDGLDMPRMDGHIKHLFDIVQGVVRAKAKGRKRREMAGPLLTFL